MPQKVAAPQVEMVPKATFDRVAEDLFQAQQEILKLETEKNALINELVQEGINDEIHKHQMETFRDAYRCSQNPSFLMYYDQSGSRHARPAILDLNASAKKLIWPNAHSEQYFPKGLFRNRPESEKELWIFFQECMKQGVAANGDFSFAPVEADVLHPLDRITKAQHFRASLHTAMKFKETVYSVLTLFDITESVDMKRKNELVPHTYDKQFATQCIIELQNSKSDFILVFLDLDDFKKLNEQLGHGTGDEILRIVGERIHHHCRKTDVFARWGGDEFLLIVQVSKDSTVQSTLRSVKARLEEITASVAQPIHLDTPIGPRTRSIGISAGYHVFLANKPAKLLVTAKDIYDWMSKRMLKQKRQRKRPQSKVRNR